MHALIKSNNNMYNQDHKGTIKKYIFKNGLKLISHAHY